MNMFPPIEDIILQNNPKFTALHKTLTTRILNPDGSSIHPAATDRDARAETLKAHRISASKADILRSSLASLPLSTTAKQPLPPDLLELIILLSLQLSKHTPLSPSSLALLQSTEVYASLPSHLPTIGALLSAHLQAQALYLARLLHPSTNVSNSTLSRQIPNIITTIRTLQASIASKKDALSLARANLVPLTLQLLSTYRAATALTIQILEQNKHGALSRSVKARAELAAVSAQQEGLNASILKGNALAAVYSDEVRSALRNYEEHLRIGRARLRERKGEAEKELARYGVGREGDDGLKERTMKEVARVYGEMGRSLKEVNSDVERLEGRHRGSK